MNSSMNSLVLEEAFPTWKMLDELVDTLLKPGAIDKNALQTLANMVMSKEFSRTFIYIKEPGITLQTYNDIVNDYCCFVTWLLGQFFYFLTCDSTELLIDAQLSIIKQLSITQVNVYGNLGKEYCKVINMLCNYLKDGCPDSMKVNVFEGKKSAGLSSKLNLNKATIVLTSKELTLKLVKKVLRIVEFVLVESITFCNIDCLVTQAMKDLVFLLQSGYFQFEVSSVFVQLLGVLQYHINDVYVEVLNNVQAFSSLFEQLSYNFYHNTVNLNKDLFEKLLFQFVERSYKLELSLGQSHIRLVDFIVKMAFKKNLPVVPSKEIQTLCIEKQNQSIKISSKEEIDSILDQQSVPLFGKLKQKILNEISEHSNLNQLDVCNISPTWMLFCNSLNSQWDDLNCTETSCQANTMIAFCTNICGILLKMKLKVHGENKRKDCLLHFFNESVLTTKLLFISSKHYISCQEHFSFQILADFLVQHLVVSDCKNIDIIYHLIGCKLLVGTVYNSASQLPDDYVGTGEWNAKLKAELSTLYNSICRDKRVTNEMIFKGFSGFFRCISSGLIKNLNGNHLAQIEELHLTLLKTHKSSSDNNVLCQIVEQTPYILYAFSKKDDIFFYIWIPLMSSKILSIQHKVAQIIQMIVCTSHSDFVRTFNSTGDQFYCLLCHKDNLDKHKETPSILLSKNKISVATSHYAMLKAVINFMLSTNEELRCLALKVLPSFSQHVWMDFYRPDIMKTWIENCGDAKLSVRKAVIHTIHDTVAHGLNNPDISDQIKSDVLDVIFPPLFGHVKKSLKYLDYELQVTLLDTLNELGRIDNVRVKLECAKMLLYFIMVPTSKYWYMAVNRCAKLSAKNAEGHLIVYKQNTDALCEVVVHLCYCNQYIVNASLRESLCKVGVVLGFTGVKDFVTKEAKKLLPYLLVKSVKNPNVRKLIEEMAVIMEVEVSDLLTTNYGNIFLYLCLESSDANEAKCCFNYIESVTKLSGKKLRNLNIRVIPNELLLNFHEKRQQVLKTFQMLMHEDDNSMATSVQDYIEPFFLPFLLYFDLELTSRYSNKDKILRSLADLLKFLGPRIFPLRFKIIAMLQTTHYFKHPELTCNAWEAFIQSCDLDNWGPHLATIFASMVPLLETCPNNVNKIFYKLVVEHEEQLKEYIQDLFFLENNLISVNVLAVIKKHLRANEGLPLRQQIVRYLKYFKHDTIEVRVQGLKRLKMCLEANREELDQMVLGYNGMDQTLVELIDCLTLGCREKDSALKLVCGEVFGELGAVEPSHLPRRYSHDSRSFVFFLTDDSFIETALMELIKAFQTDKNAQNTDRVALAIQEILKTYEISPEGSSARQFMWNKFPESHREVMTPLLSSKYICVENFSGYSCPVYGSADGASFQSWLYNWTSSLINSLAAEHRSLLVSCYPSMKLDKRVLMHFLPYILLHSLLGGSPDNEEKTYTEFSTILNSFSVNKTINATVLNTRSLAISGLTPSVRKVTGEEEKQVKCTRVVFILLDFLDRWLRESQWQKERTISTDRYYQTIKRFVSKFDKLELAKCNYKCGEYPRALLYLEMYINENPDQVSRNLQFLAEIYAQMDEPDGVLGVEPLQQSEPSLEQKLLSLEVSGKLNDAAAVYELLPRPLQSHHIQGLIQCYLNLNEVNTALCCAQQSLNLHPQMERMMLDMQAEALWRLGSYNDLEVLLNKPGIEHNGGFGIQVGKSLLCIKNGERNNLKLVLETIRKQLVDSFGAASLEEGAYHHGYNHITRLHWLTELEQLEKSLFELFLKPNDPNYVNTILTKMFNDWQLRIKVVQESVRVVEPLLCMRRVALNLAREVAEKKAPQAVPFLDKMLGESWLQSVNVARAAGLHQQAYTYVLNAEKFNSPKLFIEKAKLHWLRTEHEEALITLKRGLNQYIPDGCSSQESQQIIASLSVDQKKLCAEARLLVANYNNDICSVDVETNLQQYKDAVETFKEWEKNLVCLAQYQDRILQNYSDEQRDTKASELQLHIVHNFGRSLYYGTKYVYQSMPRLLSIWFDYGTRLSDVSNNSAKEERRLVLIKMTKIIDSFLNKLPAFVFLTSFSQIISRIAHPQKEVYVQLKSIIVKLMQHYPQQCLWMISSVIKSSNPIRVKRCSEILNDPKLQQPPLSRLIKDFTSLAEKLIELCNKEIPGDINSTTVNLLARSLPRMLSQNFSEIMMPTFKFRKLILPNPDFKNTQNHNPFPNRYVHIVGIDDKITILQSLQRPRKMSFRGSDGKSYTFMLKPKDDLRKDFRLMEFNDIVNHLLMRDPEARQRRLNIRLYSVAPLNEECGLIEWVDNLIGLRPVLMNIYKQRGLGMKPKEIKAACCSIKDPLSKKRDVFNNILLKNYPPVLGEWFRKTFPDAQTWFTARTGYIRSNAVISITGYILGLGDRHGENILLDSTCGDVVHVDFNCLFNKGETFEYPERVPFRLTHNMISAMGPLGVEGVFRKSCEFTLRVLRSNTDTLLSIVTPFVYDPLVSWPRNVPVAAQSSEKVNEQAVEHVKNIELRLQGKVKTRSRAMSQCLSIEGQVDYLINEAKSVDNLCQMYIGWGPYL